MLQKSLVKTWNTNGPFWNKAEVAAADFWCGAFVFGKASDDMIHHVTVRPATLPRRAGSQVCRWGEYREVGALWKKDLVFDRTECPFPSSKAVVSRLLIKSQNNLECLALLGPCLRQISPD